MCGIAGEFRFDGVAPDAAAMARMRAKPFQYEPNFGVTSVNYDFVVAAGARGGAAMKQQRQSGSNLSSTSARCKVKKLYCRYRRKKMIAVAKITAKGQTTIPQDVCAALHVAAGDLIAWEVGTDGTAMVRRVQPLDIEYLRAVDGTFSEWASTADEEAYREL